MAESQLRKASLTLARCGFGCEAPPPAATQGAQTCVRTYLGTLEFQGFGGLGFQGLFESAGFRVLVQLGSQAKKRWMGDDGPVTQKQMTRYSRVVSSDGRYKARMSCEFDEAVDLPRPSGSVPQELVADIWMERRTVVEFVDSILDTVGLGNNLPQFDHTWVGRATVTLPPEGVDAIPKAWPVNSELPGDGAHPHSLSVGIEWVAGGVPDD
jgi:hypothetical protein